MKENNSKQYEYKYANEGFIDEDDIDNAGIELVNKLNSKWNALYPGNDPEWNRLKAKKLVSMIYYLKGDIIPATVSKTDKRPMVWTDENVAFAISDQKAVRVELEDYFKELFPDDLEALKIFIPNFRERKSKERKVNKTPTPDPNNEMDTMRYILNKLVDELGKKEGTKTFEWYCKTYNVGISDIIPLTVLREVLGIDLYPSQYYKRKATEIEMQDKFKKSNDMRITKDNLASEYENYKMYLKDDEMRNKVKDAIEISEFYGEDADITKAVDSIVDMVNEQISKNGKKDEKWEKFPIPQYKVGDWVTTKDSSGKENTTPILISEWNETPDGRIVYTADGGDYDFFEDSIVQKVTEPKFKIGHFVKYKIANAGGEVVEVTPVKGKKYEYSIKYPDKNGKEVITNGVMESILALSTKEEVDKINHKTTETAKEEKKEDDKVKKEKNKKTPKPKFKVGDKVITDHSNNIYTIVETKGGQYLLDKTTGWWSESQLTAAPKPKKEPKQKKDPEPFKGETLPTLPEEVKLIKRYIWMQGRKMSEIKNHKSNNPNTLLNAVQKAITEKKIRKTSKYAEEIMQIQKSLVKMCNGIIDGLYGASDKFESKNYEALKAIVDSYRVGEDTKISNAYIKNQEKANKKKEAENLLKRMDKAVIPDDRKDEFAEMKKALKAYIDGKTEKIEATERQLRGLYGILNNQQRGKLQGVDDLNADHQGVVSTTDFVNARFNKMGFTGRWLSLIGDPCENFKMMVYGSAGNGKSTFCLLFAKYLSQNLGKKVLYIASEEKFGYTLQEKIERLNVANDNFYIAERIPLDLGEYDVVFFDSVNDLGIDPDELNEITDGIASVAIFQCTKDGDYRGGSEFKHDADVVIKVENMVATIDGKNRFGGAVGAQFAVR